MQKVIRSYFGLILVWSLCLFSCKHHAQTKSTNIQTINGKKYYIHKVEKGQSLYAIAKVYNMDVNAILSENDEAIDGIKQGQELKIPFETSSIKPVNPIDTNKYTYHKVQKGETVYAITKKYSIDEAKLKSWNPTIMNGLKEGEFIVVGEKRKVGAAKPVTNVITPTFTTYVVQQGETLYGICKRFNITQEEIVKWNPESKDGVKSGQVLRIPGAVNSVVNPNSNQVGSNPVKDTVKFIGGKKQKYEVGLFLPFKFSESEMLNVEDLVRSKNPFPPVQSLSLDYYLGFKTAVDSLVSNQFELNINLFDMEDRDSAKIETICKSPDFKKLDVIFGPLYLSGFKIVSAYAKEKGIPIISPSLQQNKILYQNRLVSKVTPSAFTLIESLSNFCVDSLFNTSNMMIVNSTPKDLQYLKSFKNQYNYSLVSKGYSIKDSIKTVKGIAGVKEAFVPNKKNVIVLFTNNQVYLQDFITQLYAFSDKKDIVLCGFSSVSNLDNLDQEYLNKLQYHFADASCIDYSQPAVIQLAKHYQSLYTTDPSDYYFQAHDAATYYFSNLKNQGMEFFLNLDKNVWYGNSIGFKFFRPDTETGFENKAISIYRYSNYKLQKLGWK